RIEGGIRHRQRERAAVDDCHRVREAGGGVERFGRGAEFRRQIDPGHPHREFRGEPAGRATNPRADVEDTLAGLERELRRELLAGEEAAAVKMVERRQAVGREPRIRAVRLAPGGEDPPGDPGAAVMPPDCCRRVHAGLPPAWLSDAAMLRHHAAKTYPGRRTMAVKIERQQPDGVNVRMQQGKAAYSHVVTVTGPGKT